jgi:hypothetical protein
VLPVANALIRPVRDAGQMFPDNDKVVVNYILYLTELNQPLVALDVASTAMKVQRGRLCQFVSIGLGPFVSYSRCVRPPQ